MQVGNTPWMVGSGGLAVTSYGGQTVVHGAPIEPVVNQPVFTYVG